MELAVLARAHLLPAGQQQIGLYLRMLGVTAGEIDALCRQLVSAAGRFSSARKAVRFTGPGTGGWPGQALESLVVAASAGQGGGRMCGRQRR